MKHLFGIGVFLFVWAATALGQQGAVYGYIKNPDTQKGIAGVSVSADGTQYGVQSDSMGFFRLLLPVGNYNFTASHIGYGRQTKFNITVITGNDQLLYFEFSNQGAAKSMDEVVVSTRGRATAIATDMVTPMSVQRLTTQEIRANPGSNFDVSKVVQTLPGVGLSNGVGDRNDIIIRGGAPNENVYYLDGIEIPVLNHFQTQGSSGGAQGILNLSFIEELKLSTSAFDAKYDNPLSSTFVIKQRDGNPNRLSGNLRTSLTESSLTLEGPLSPKTTFLSSARISYLGLLFKMVDLPIRPNFSDYQFKVKHRFNDKTTLSAIGLGAIDNFHFAPTKESTPEQTYVLRSTPYINQWTYILGFDLNHRIKNGFWDLIISRNVFETRLDKFEDEQKVEANRTLKIRSQEAENKFKFEINQSLNGWKLSAGAMAQYATYTGDVFNKIGMALTDENGDTVQQARTIVFASAINLWRYGIFTQAAKYLFDEKLLLSGGLRTDMNSFTQTGNQPLETLSPRFSVSYKPFQKWAFNATTGIYYKLPVYTMLGYQDKNGLLANKDLPYIRSKHVAVGTEYLPKNSLRFTLEGFYKKYDQYPISATTGVSMANQGTQYGSVGSEPIIANGMGETYGVEVFAQQKLSRNFYYVASYSYVVSRFSGSDGRLLPSSWDNRHLLTATLGYKLKSNWDFGLKYRFAGGSPTTPFDMAASQENYLLIGQGVLDYSATNSLRLDNYRQLDVRVDKRINFRRTTLNLYLDVQNLLMLKNESNPNYTFKRNEPNTAFLTTDAKPIQPDGSNGIPVIVTNKSGHPLPSIGVIWEF